MTSDRESYTWDHAAKDLALLTPLTMLQAVKLCQPLEATELHPWDAVGELKLIVGAMPMHPENIGMAIYALLTGKEWRPW